MQKKGKFLLNANKTGVIASLPRYLYHIIVSDSAQINQTNGSVLSKLRNSFQQATGVASVANQVAVLSPVSNNNSIPVPSTDEQLLVADQIISQLEQSQTTPSNDSSLVDSVPTQPQPIVSKMKIVEPTFVANQNMSSQLAQTNQSIPATLPTQTTLPATAPQLTQAPQPTQATAPVIAPQSVTVSQPPLQTPQPLQTDQLVTAPQSAQVGQPLSTPQPVVTTQPIQATQPIPTTQPLQTTLPDSGIIAQTLPTAINNIAQQNLNPSAPTRSAKETLETNRADGAIVEAGKGIQVVEVEPTPEISPEVEAYVQKAVQSDQMPQEIVIADNPSAVPNTLHHQKQPVIVLPITPETEKKARFKSPKFSIRWLVEWSRKIMKMFFGKVIYRQEEIT